MRNTIKHILVSMVVAFISITAVAQERELNKEQKAQLETQLEVYFQKLDLSEKQKPKFEEITKKYGKQMMALKESDKGRLSKYKEYKSIMNNKNREMKALLSDKQYIIFEKTQEEMQKKMKEKRNSKK